MRYSTLSEPRLKGDYMTDENKTGMEARDQHSSKDNAPQLDHSGEGGANGNA